MGFNVELNRTTKALTESMTDYLPELHVEEQDRALTRQIQIFREKTIAPLESIVAKFPQIQHQLDHRRGAWETAERYRFKLEDMQRKTRWNKSARVLRVGISRRLFDSTCVLMNMDPLESNQTHVGDGTISNSG